MEAVRRELHQLPARQFEDLYAGWSHGQSLHGRVSSEAEPLPESLLNHLFDLPSTTISAAMTQEASLRRHVAELRELIEQESINRTDALIEYVVDAPAEEMDERAVAAWRVVTCAARRSPSRGRLDLSELRISRIPDLSCFRGVFELDLHGCTTLTNLEGLRNFPILQTVNLAGCTGLTSLSGMANLANLQRLLLNGCTSLTSLESLADQEHLRFLDLTGCTSLTTLQGLPEFPGLRTLCLAGCTGLTGLQGLRDLPNLQRVVIQDCPQLISLGVDTMRNSLPANCVWLVSVTEQAQAPLSAPQNF